MIVVHAKHVVMLVIVQMVGHVVVANANVIVVNTMAKKKTKMMAKGGKVKKTKMMAKGGKVKGTKMYSKGGKVSKGR